MYFLDFLSKEMTGEKRELALKLLRDPLGCDSAAIRRWVDSEICELFSVVQSQCLKDLRHRTPKLFRLKMGWMRIGVTGTMPDGKEAPIDELSKHVVSQLCGQVREDMWRKGERFDELPIEARTSLLFLYAMAELIFWLLFEVVREIDGQFVITNDSMILEGLRLYVLGHQLARDSFIADALDQAYLLEHARKAHGSLESMLRDAPTTFESFVDRTLDKCFSCHPDFIDLMQSRNKGKFEIFRRRSRLICYLFLRSQEELVWTTERSGHDVWATDFPTSMTMENLQQAGFLSEDIEFLLHLSDKAEPGGKLLRIEEDNCFSVGDLSLKYALGAYSKDFFDSNAMYGDWFEKSYIENYLKSRIENSRYAALKGFRSGSDEPIKYDVDVMIFDRKFCRLYFLQIKHRDDTLLPYLRDELYEFSMNKAINKAVEQLKGVKENLESEKLIDRIKNSFRLGDLNARLIDPRYLQTHSGFIIIHTIENFDFGVKDGMAMYEWNTFRNLLKEEMVRHVGRVHHSVRTDLGGSQLDDPRQVADALIRWNDAQPYPVGQPSLSEKLQMKERLYYDILSTRVVEILGRWEFLRPFLKMKFPLI